MRLSRRVNWRCGFAVAAMLVLTAPERFAHAQQSVSSDMIVDGKFYNPAGTAVLVIVTAKPTKEESSKAAIVGIQYENIDKNLRFNGTYGRLNVGFAASDWPKFAAIWRNVRTARGDAKGDYFDGKTIVTVTSGSDGKIDFTMAGNGYGERYVPRDLYIFSLSVEDIPAFDASVREVSAYFTK
jgi:hypothetical protein